MILVRIHLDLQYLDLHKSDKINLVGYVCHAGENHQLANHVHTAQVDTWIRLAVALLLSQSYGLREWNDAGDGVSDLA